MSEVGGGRGQLSPRNLCPRDPCPRVFGPRDCPQNLSPRDRCPRSFCPRPCPRSPLLNFSVPVPGPRFSNLCPRPCPRSPIFEICVPVPVSDPRFSKFVSPFLSPVPNFHNFCPHPCPRSPIRKISIPFRVPGPFILLANRGDSTIRNRPMSESFFRGNLNSPVDRAWSKTSLKKFEFSNFSEF